MKQKPYYNNNNLNSNDKFDYLSIKQIKQIVQYPALGNLRQTTRSVM